MKANLPSRQNLNKLIVGSEGRESGRRETEVVLSVCLLSLRRDQGVGAVAEMRADTNTTIKWSKQLHRPRTKYGVQGPIRKKWTNMSLKK